MSLVREFGVGRTEVVFVTDGDRPFGPFGGRQRVLEHEFADVLFEPFEHRVLAVEEAPSRVDCCSVLFAAGVAVHRSGIRGE